MRAVVVTALFAGLLVAIVAGTAAQAQPVRIDAADNAAGLEVRVEPDGPVPLDSRLQFVTQTARKGYLVLLLIEPDGDVRQIYPRLQDDGLPFGATDETNALLPGRPATIPDAANVLGNFELFAAEPGAHAVVALLSPVPVQLVGVTDLPSDGGDVAVAVRNVLEMARGLRVAPRGGRGAPVPLRWSMAVATFKVD